MSKSLETIAFNPSRFEKELEAFEALLRSKPDLSERGDIQPFFEKNQHLSAYMGIFSLNIGPATELAFQYPFFGDFRADLLLGNKKYGEFCVVEFEHGRRNSIFKKMRDKATPEWSSRFDHGFSQIVDWFYSLDNHKTTEPFQAVFGYGHVKFIGLLVIGRNAGLDDAGRRRLKWRTEKILVDSHQVNCLTFDDLHVQLQNQFRLYKAASNLEKGKRK